MNTEHTPDPKRQSYDNELHAAQEEIARLNRELEAILNDVPVMWRVMIREGSGQLNLVASLAISVSKMRRELPGHAQDPIPECPL